MPESTAQRPTAPATALSGADGADELAAMNNAYAAYEEFGNLDGMRSAFEHMRDVAYRFMAAQKLDAPVRAPWNTSERIPRPGHYRGWEEE